MLRLRDIMTTDVVTVSPELTVRDAMALFATRHLSGAPVVASGKVVGVVTATDLMEMASSLPGVPAERPEPEDEDQWERAEEAVVDEEDESSMAFFADSWEDAGAEVSERMREVGGPEWNALEEHTVAEAMTRDLFSLPPDTSVELAAGRMRDAKVHRVLVMEGDALLGIVTTTDITDAVAEHKLTTQRYVFSPKVDIDGRSWR
ncbi:MAG: CBS domain-containing protein [Gemmatimonadota bacterium]